jgi:GTP-binding protein
MALVAIIGRPNVGKSTLFNRIVGQRKAVVEDIPGVTRDRIYGHASWGDKNFMVVDTGGFETNPDHELIRQVRHQALIAMEEADVILFMMDGSEGLHVIDRELHELLRRYDNKKIFFIVNKIDGLSKESYLYDFYDLGVERLTVVSAKTGYEFEELMNEVVKVLPQNRPETEDYPKIAIVGRPNVGKSTLVNALTGKERMIVSDSAGTTRDAIDSLCIYYSKKYTLIDTAGIRRQGKMAQGIERFSFLRTMHHVDRCDVALIIVSIEEGIVEMDQKIAGLVHDAGRGAVIVINKWDTAENKERLLQETIQTIRQKFWFMPYAPVITISALTKQRVTKLFHLVDEIMANREMKFKTSELNSLIHTIRSTWRPPLYKGKTVSLKFMSQVGEKPPGFVVFSNRPEALSTQYIKYIEKTIRQKWPLTGTPIRIYIKKKNGHARL